MILSYDVLLGFWMATSCKERYLRRFIQLVFMVELSSKLIFKVSTYLIVVSFCSVYGNFNLFFLLIAFFVQKKIIIIAFFFNLLAHNHDWTEKRVQFLAVSLETKDYVGFPLFPRVHCYGRMATYPKEVK